MSREHGETRADVGRKIKRGRVRGGSERSELTSRRGKERVRERGGTNLGNHRV